MGLDSESSHFFVCVCVCACPLLHTHPLDFGPLDRCRVREANKQDGDVLHDNFPSSHPPPCHNTGDSNIDPVKCNKGLQLLKCVSYAAVKASCCTLINMCSQSTVSNFAPESPFHSRLVGLVSPKT